MRRTFTTLLILFGTCFTYQLRATHIVGAELEYECLNPLNNTYKLTLTLYRDCARGEAAFDDVVTLFLFDRFGKPVNFVNILRPPVTPQIQPESFASCIAVPPQICVEEGIYETTVILPPKQGGYNIAWARCCRNSAINNLAVPLREGVTFLAHVPDPGAAVCNSMPKFENVPPVFLCNEKEFSFDHSAVDIDGDSLSYAITNPYTGLNQSGLGAGNPNFGQAPPQVNTGNNPMGPPPYLNVEFSSGFRYNDPFGSGNFEIDPVTGFIQVTPDKAGIYVYAISVYEWRDGKLLSENKRDFQIHVINCRPQGDPPIISHDLSGLDAIDDTIFVNARERFCYDINVRDVNMSDQLTAFAVSSAFGKGNFLPPAAVFNFGGINPIQGQVCWNINCAYEGQVIPLVVGARDINDCPNIGNVFDTVWVKVQIPPNTLPVITPDYTGLRFDQDTIVAIADQDMCFSFDITDAESNRITPYTISDIFAGSNAPSFDFTGNGPVDGQICWKPSCDLTDQVVEITFGAREDNICAVSSPVTSSVYVRIEAPANDLPVIQRELSGLNVVEDTVFVNPLDELCYSYTVTDGNNIDKLKVFSESTVFDNEAGAVFTTEGINPVRGEVCWTPGCDFAEKIVQIVVVAEDNPVCANVQPIYDTLYVKVGPDLSSAPDISHSFTGGLVSEDTVILDVGESICYDFAVADKTPFSGVRYEYEFQTFEGTNIALGSASVVQRNDSILGAFCFQSDCSNGGSLYRVIIKGIDEGLCPPFPVAYDTVYIKVETDFLSDVGPDLSFCDGEGGIQLKAEPQGGGGSYYYNWGCTDPSDCGLSNPYVQNPIVNPAGPTSYFVQITDKDGCTSEIDSIQIDINSLPQVDAGQDQEMCLGDDAVQLTTTILNEQEISGNLTFEWFPKEGLSDPYIPNPQARPGQSTIYTVIAKSQNGCSSTATNLDTMSTVEVRVLETPISEAGEDRVICEGESIELMGYAKEGTPDYSFEWLPTGSLQDANSQSPIASPNTNTVYYFRASSGACAGEWDSLFVEVQPTPKVSPLASYEICSYESIELVGTASGANGATFEYEWETAEGILNIQNDLATVNPHINTVYNLTVTSGNGCTETYEFPVNVLPTPIVSAGDDRIACEGDEIQLNATSVFVGGDGVNFPTEVNYTWLPNSGISDPIAQNPVLLPQQTTIYTVKASYGRCETEDEMKVDVFSPLSIQLSADATEICSGQDVALSVAGATSGAKYTWYPETNANGNVSSQIVSPQENTMYYVSIDDGGCSRTDSIAITVNQTPEGDFFVSSNSGCEDLRVSVAENSGSGVNFIWDFGDGSPSAQGATGEHVFEEPGTYWVTMTATGANGCTSEEVRKEIIVSEKGVADFSSDPPPGASLFLPNPQITLTDKSQNAIDYTWLFGDGNSSSEQNPVHIYTAPGTYQISLAITDKGNCTDTLSLGPYIINAPELLIPNIFSPNDDGVNDEFIVKYIGKESFTMQVFDRWGNPMFEELSTPTIGWNGIRPDGKIASEGVYYYFIQIGEKAYKGNVTLLR